MQIRSRLGYYEFGNKVMDYPRIRRQYLRSRTFVLDIVALLPLYIVNWCLPVNKRWGLLNVNKLLRLFKVPRQFHALETRYVKHTTELRLFKLLYYTFMLSHFLGCIWFNFASKEAAPRFASTGDTKETAFGGITGSHPSTWSTDHISSSTWPRCTGLSASCRRQWSRSSLKPQRSASSALSP